MVRRIINIFYKEFTTINQAAILLGIFTLLSQVLGLVRDRLLASEVGVSASLDVYYAAFRIPDIVFALAASLVSITILIPFFIEAKHKDSEHRGHSQKFINSVFTAFFIGIIVLSAIIFILMPYLAPMIAPGFDADQISSLIQLSRIMLLSPIFLGFSNLFGTITQSARKFFVYATAPILYNAGIVIGIIALYPIFGIHGLVYGVIIGAILHMAIQIPVIIRQGYIPRLTSQIHWKYIGRITALSLPRTFTLSINKILIAVFIALASKISDGAVSIFNFAWNLQNVPLALIGMSFSVAAFPTLVQYFADNDRENFLKQIIAPARQIIFWSLPVIVFFIVLRAHIVRVILGAGYFSWTDTRLTAAALALFVLSIMFQGLILLLVRGYYAAGQTWRPLWITVVGASVSMASAFGFLHLFETYPVLANAVESMLRVQGVPGTSVLMLALAYTCGEAIRFIIMYFWFRREYMRGYAPGLARVFLESLIGSLVMGFSIYHLLQIFNQYFDINTFTGVFMQGFLSGSIGIILAVLTLVALGNQELRAIYHALSKKGILKSPPVDTGKEDVM